MNNTYLINYQKNNLTDSNINFTNNEENKEYYLKYENAITSIKNFLKKIISKYNSKLSISEDGLTTSFKIKVPKNTSVKDLVKYSEEILEKVSKFIDYENISFILPKLNIAITRQYYF